MLTKIEVAVAMTAGRVTFYLDVPAELAALDAIGAEPLTEALRQRFERALVVGDLNADRWRS
jgi:hypothetical protein